MTIIDSIDQAWESSPPATVKGDDAVLEDLAAAMDVAHAAHRQKEDRGGEDVAGFHQAQLHGAGIEVAADCRQRYPDRRHHEGHQEVGGADDHQRRGSGHVLGH